MSQPTLAARLAPVLVLYALLVGFACLFWRSPVLLLGLYVALSAAGLAVWRDRSARLHYLSGFVLGPLGEFLAVSSGAWQYGESLLGLPLWLPLAWGLAVLCTHRLARVFVRSGPRETARDVPARRPAPAYPPETTASAAAPGSASSSGSSR